MVMYQAKVGKSLLWSYKPPQKKNQPQKDIEKLCPERMTEDGLTKPKKSCEPQRVPFRTFIKPYSEKYPHCRLLILIIMASIVVLVTVVLLICVVFQEAKHRAVSHDVGDVLESFSSQPSATFTNPSATMMTSL